MHSKPTQRGPGSQGQADVETGKPQDPRDRRMPGEGGSDAERTTQHSQQGSARQQQGAGSQSHSQQAGGGSGHRPSQQTQQQPGTQVTGTENLQGFDDPDHGKLVTEDPDGSPPSRAEAPLDDPDHGKLVTEDPDAEQQVRREGPRKPGSGPDE